uniref:Disease resistance R13L4/SHOC-2-like LRR domain-containing protein n=1 Tax=Fagus sylvatica TaxID=28930 RepID=A0A2N9F0M3_FAGSY
MKDDHLWGITNSSNTPKSNPHPLRESRETAHQADSPPATGVFHESREPSPCTSHSTTSQTSTGLPSEGLLMLHMSSDPTTPGRPRAMNREHIKPFLSPLLRQAQNPEISLILNMLILLLCIGAFQVKAQVGGLPNDEVQALQEIAKQLGKKDWNFGVDPCNDTSWQTPQSNLRPLYNNSLICNCSYSFGVCHVVKLFLKGQDLDGMLPPSLVKLPYLNTIDLTRNYLSGTIPPEWASTKLEYLSITVNNLSGPIPSYLGNITTLIYMSIESNLFSGTIPPELGNLTNLANLILSANNFTSELPVSLTNLTRLTELRISSNNFIGRIPDFFQSWKQLQKLEIQASGLEGPLPYSISVLSNLIELRISDLLGGGSEFPPLNNMTLMNRLMLRSCNLSGPIPAYICIND